MDSPVGVVFAIDEHFVLPLAVSLRSIFDNTAEPNRLHVVVLARGLSDQDRHRLGSVHDSTRPRLDIVDIGHLDFSDLREWQHISNVMHARMMLQDFIPESWRRAVYLDADVLVLGDIVELCQADLDGQVLGAVEDDIIHVFFAANYPDRRGDLDGRVIFNTGVLVIDLERWRAEDIGGRALALARDRDACLTGTDQEALNATVDGRWKPLDPAWNVMTHFYYRPRSRRKYAAALQRMRLRHFTSEHKPWFEASQVPDAELYRQVMARLPWAHATTQRWWTVA